MEVEKKLKQIEKILDSALKELELLEKEKTYIMEKFANANETERKNLKEDIKVSEEKFKTLAENVFILGQKIKELKNSTDNT